MGNAVNIFSHFNPLPPHGGRPNLHKTQLPFRYFNPLPPHGGRQQEERKKARATYHFNPLPPHGGRLIHPFTYHLISTYFNPLPPHGGRLDRGHIHTHFIVFQSTPSAWRETGKPGQTRNRPGRISIHSLRMEGDGKAVMFIITDIIISIHSLRMEGDRYYQYNLITDNHFNPLPPHGGRR